MYFHHAVGISFIFLLFEKFYMTISFSTNAEVYRPQTMKIIYTPFLYVAQRAI